MELKLNLFDLMLTAYHYLAHCTLGGMHLAGYHNGGSALALDSTQQSHAQTIANVAKNYGTNSPQHACVTAVATAITESALYIYANSKVPASLNYPHDKVGSDHDSVGLFQQRVSIYKNIAADMDATGSTRQFLAEMVKISGWQSIAPGTLAQKVQRSA
ncbi:hypothetical protein OC835_007813, partial [Tilletia horrida]